MKLPKNRIMDFEKIGVFWKTVYPKFIKESFLHKNIYSNLEDFTQKQYENLNELDGIILLCELDTNQQGEKINLQDLYGVEVAKQLRRNNVNIPILFTSFLSRKVICAKKPEREIITTIGHDFIRLPAKTEDLIISLTKINKLNELELYDIKNSYCSREGMVRELVHRLSNLKYFDLNNKTSDEVKKNIIDAIKDIYSLYSNDPTKFINELEYKFNEVNEENISEIILEINRQSEKLISDYSPNILVESVTEKRNWKILWVDDEADGNHRLISFLKKLEVEVILSNSSSKAVDILNNDWVSENRIAVLIADYRLYEIDKDDVKVQQKMQGHSLLKKVVDSERMIRLAALSALPRKFLLRSLREFNIRSEVFSKRDYLEDDNTIKLLCEELIEMGDENEEAVLSIPDDASGWKYLKPTYSQYRNWPEYLSMERRISEKAKVYIEYFEKTGKLPDPIPFSKSIYKKENSIEKNLSKFQSYWLARRIAIWLGGVKKFSNSQIAEILKNEIKSDYKQVISQYLGIRMEDYPFGITVEEKNWLQYYIGIPIYKEIESQGSLISDIKEIFQQYLNEFSSSIDPLPNLTNYFSIKQFYRNTLKELEIHKDKQLNLVSKINHLFETVYNKTYFFEYPKGASILLAYFIREYRYLLKELGKDDKSIKLDKEENYIKKYYDMIVQKKYPDFKKLNEKDKESFQNIYAYSFNEDGEIIEFDTMIENYRNSISGDDAMERQTVEFKDISKKD